MRRILSWISVLCLLGLTVSVLVLVACAMEAQKPPVARELLRALGSCLAFALAFIGSVLWEEHVRKEGP